MTTPAFTLAASHEWSAHGPWGNPKPGDMDAGKGDITDDKGRVTLRAARNGYISFRVRVQGSGEFKLSASSRSGLELDLFKVWYHRMHTEEGEKPDYWPDALVPLRKRVTHQIPDPDNAIEGQTEHTFWVDIYVPKNIQPGTAKAAIRLTAGDEKISLPVQVEILEQLIPDEPSVTMDFNSYGCRFFAGLYPKTFEKVKKGEKFWNKCIELVHNYHRIVYEHRGLLHNLGCGHSGFFDPIYGPRTEGTGRDKKLVHWDSFDRHYGPLLDGSAFETAGPGAPPPRRKAKPIWGVYTPINPNWPADYLWWGQKGYEVEFTKTVAEFDAHLKEKGWTNSYIEFFFNHKKRYRWFAWDGDEPKFVKDMGHHEEMIRIWEKATLDSPVKWVYRMDASWQMRNQFKILAGHRNFWVCAGFYRWYPEEIKKTIDRGEITWFYNGTPPVQGPSSGILGILYDTWSHELHGNCQWQTVQPGPDPWFDCTGASTGSIYPGERFGIPGPIPSIRMKVLRNGIQDIDLLNQKVEAAGNAEQVRAQLAEAIPIPVWTKPPRAAVELPPEDWDAYNLNEDHEPEHKEKKGLEPDWWQTIRDLAVSQEDKS